MWDLEIGTVRFVVEHRSLGGDGGPTLRVYEGAGAKCELLRFDCFAKTPHWHVAPEGSNEVSRLDPTRDTVSWTMEQLGRDFDGLLARAGLPPGKPTDPAALAIALRRAEGAMRNPPPDFDNLDLGRLRQRRGEKWARYPEDTIAAWVADMDFPVAEPIRRVLQRALDLGDVGYPINPRPTDLPTLFAERARERWSWEVEPRRVEVITDVVQGIYVSLEVYAEEGDGAVIQTPIYPPFLQALADTARRLVEAPLVEGSNGLEINLDQLRGAIDARTRLLLLCNPHNPTGRVFTRSELEALAEIALERDLVVISDEIHADLVFPGRAHIPFATLGPEVEKRTLTLYSATKAFNVAGLRCAVAAFGSDELKRRFMRVPRHSRGGLGSLGMAATDAAWRHCQPWLEQVLEYLDGNRRFLERFVAEQLPGVRHHAPEATYLAWLDCRALELPDGPYSFFLERARVALSDGRSFGEPGEGFVRLNFATSRGILTEILERLAKAVQSHTGRA